MAQQDEPRALSRGDVRQHLVPVPGWGYVIVLYTNDGRMFFALRQLCTMLGIAPQKQAQRIQEHAVLRRMLWRAPIETETRGYHDAYIIERRALGFWLGSIQLSSVRPQVQARLMELQEDVVTAADKAMWGDVAPDPVRAQLATLDGQIADVRRFALGLEHRVGHIEGQVFKPDDLADGSEGEP